MMMNNYKNQSNFEEYVQKEFQGKSLEMALNSLQFLEANKIKIQYIKQQQDNFLSIFAIQLQNNQLLDIEIYDIEFYHWYQNALKYVKAIKSEYILKYLSNLEDKYNRLYFIIYEGMTYNLNTYIEDYPHQEEDEIIQIFTFLLKALIDISKQSIIHCDIKRQNILLSSPNQVKISGFYLAQTFTNELELKSEGNTLTFCSPEQIQGIVRKESDYFSAGLVLLGLCNKSISSFDFMKFKYDSKFFIDENDDLKFLKEISQKMIASQPQERLSPQAALQLIENYSKSKNQNQQNSFGEITNQILNYFTPKGMNKNQILKGIKYLESKQLILQKKLGQGSYGIVFKAVQKNSKQQVAVKIVDSRDANIEKECIQEGDNLKKVNSENIIKSYDHFKHKESGFFIFVTELCLEGTLQQYVDENKNYGEEFINKIISGLMMGLAALHKANLVHSDLKLDNVLISSSGQVLICDLGLSVYIELFQSKIIQKGNSLINCAPEQLNNLVGKPSDVFSSGIILIQLLFPNIKETELLAIKTGGIIPSHNQYPHLKRLAQQMTKQVPKERLTPTQVLKELMIQKIDKKLQKVMNEPDTQLSDVIKKVDNFFQDL